MGAEFLVRCMKAKLSKPDEFTHVGYFSGKGVNRLLLHAKRFSSHTAAEECATALQNDNPEYHPMRLRCAGGQVLLLTRGQLSNGN